MKKTLGRVVGAALAGALISLAVAAPAAAQEVGITTEPAAPSYTGGPTTNDPDYTGGKVTSGQPSSDAPVPSSNKPSDPPSSRPTSSKPESSTTRPSEPPADDYVDDVAYVGSIGDGFGYLLIACKAGAPTGVSSPKFTVTEGPWQDETDGRYWSWLIEAGEGVDLDKDEIPVKWTCGSKPGGGGATPVNPGGDKGKPGSQVKYQPKKGVETGFGL